MLSSSLEIEMRKTEIIGEIDDFLEKTFEGRMNQDERKFCQQVIDHKFGPRTVLIFELARAKLGQNRCEKDSQDDDMPHVNSDDDDQPLAIEAKTYEVFYYI